MYSRIWKGGVVGLKQSGKALRQRLPKNSVGLRDTPESLGRKVVKALSWGEELSWQRRC